MVNTTAFPDAKKSPVTASSALFSQRLDTLSNQSLEQKVQVIADREEIRDLIATYAHRVAHGLSNADLFTDDGAYIHRRAAEAEPAVVRGREALVAHYIVRPDSAGNATPMIHNTLIDVAGDEGRGICSLELRVGVEGESIIASGYYEDRYRRENGVWKFFERDLTIFHWVSLKEGWAK